jgi:peptidoglycan hydrolase-like protein with peptidoglycan-binding domain
LAPTSDRYREIQAALVQRGYLKKDPNGVWDAESADALRRFQQDQSLEASGKLNSLSLIALGLGPKHSVPPPATVAPRDSVSPNPALPATDTPPGPAPDSSGPAPAGPASPSQL